MLAVALRQLGFWVFFVNLAYTIVFWASAFTLLERRRGIYSGNRRSVWAFLGGFAFLCIGTVTLSIAFVPMSWTRVIYTYVTPSLILVGVVSLVAVLRHERQLGIVAVEAIRRELE